MIDLFAVALGVVAATLLVDEVIVRSSAAATGLFALVVLALASRHGLFPGLAYAVAAFAVPIALAVLIAPVTPPAIRVARLASGGLAVIALVLTVAGAFHG